MNLVSESKIEKAVCRHWKKQGWWPIKLTAIGVRGAPDRMMCGHGKIVLIEFKTPKGRLSPGQVAFHSKLWSKCGIHAHVVRSVEEGIQLEEDARPDEL